MMHKLENFPLNFPVETTPFNTARGDRNSYTTEIHHLGISEYREEEILKYQVIHHLGENFEGTGYSEDGTTFDLVAISTVQTFNMYKTNDDHLLFSGSKKAILEHGIRRLVDGTYTYEDNMFRSQELTINLRQLKEEMEAGALAQIKGGWWRNLMIADVEVAYLGGGTVTQSQNWNAYEESEGIISALRLDLPNPLENEDEILKVLLTKNANLVIYKKVESEKDLLDIAVPLFNLAKNHLE